MEKAEIKRISEIIEKLEALKKAKEKYQSDVADRIIEEVLLELVDVEDCIAEHSKPEDGLGGNFFPPTGAFARNLMRDVRYAIKSPKHKDTNTLIQHLKIVQKRVKKPAETGGESKYTPEKIKNMQATFDKHLEEKNDVKYAWNCVVEEHGIKSAKAAEMAVRRYRKKNK